MEKDRIEFLLFLSTIVPTNSTCVEIGVDEGIFSKNIIDFLKPKQLFLVDPWEVGYDKNAKHKNYLNELKHIPTAYSVKESMDRIQEKLSKEIEKKQIILIRDFSYNAVSTFPDNTFDFIYIDACHYYESVKADLNDYLPKLKENGLMCGHDYGGSYDNPSEEGAGFGVAKAVDEFVTQNNFKWVTKNSNNWALRR